MFKSRAVLEVMCHIFETASHKGATKAGAATVSYQGASGGLLPPHINGA